MVLLSDYFFVLVATINMTRKEEKSLIHRKKILFYTPKSPFFSNFGASLRFINAENV